MINKEKLLSRIVRHLILHTSFIDNIGLLNGKMGISIFFYRYAQYTGKKYYSDFAGDLIDEIYSEIHTEYIRDFKDGLSGICWGIEYITHNNFVKANADEVLIDIDPLILERDLRRIKDTSLETGLEGLAHYVLSRSIDKPQTSIDYHYISELKQALQDNECDKELIFNLDNLLQKHQINYKFDSLDIISRKVKYKDSSIFENNKIGISQNGLAGIGLKLLNELSI